MCRDCPVQNCGARYLVTLSNHLWDILELDYNQRRKWLQEAKLQPNVKVIVYDADEQRHALKKKVKRLSQDPTGVRIKESSVVYEIHIPKRRGCKKIKRKRNFFRKKKCVPVERE